MVPNQESFPKSQVPKDQKSKGKKERVAMARNINEFCQRALYGGAISLQIPVSFEDVSSIREV